MDKHRIDIVLANGSRRRGYANLEEPSVIHSANYTFQANDRILEGARIVCDNPAVRKALVENGFTATGPNAGTSVFSVRLKAEASQHVYDAAASSGHAASAVISAAVDYWIGSGCPIEPKQRKR